MVKTYAFAEYPVTTGVHVVRRFLGLTGFFGRFVTGYATLAQLLSRLTRKYIIVE